MSNPKIISLSPIPCLTFIQFWCLFSKSAVQDLFLNLQVLVQSWSYSLHWAVMLLTRKRNINIDFLVTITSLGWYKKLNVSFFAHFFNFSFRIGVFFCPFLPLMTLVKFFVFFYLKKWSLLINMLPSQRPFRASRSGIFFMMILMITFLMCIAPVGYFIAKWV